MALVQYDNEYGRLRKIALYRPSPGEIEQKDAKSAMYISIPDTLKVLEEFDGIVEKFRALGVEVIVLQFGDNTLATSNMIYLRDVAFAFRGNLLLANMKYPLRQYETAKFKHLLMAQDPEYADVLIGADPDVNMEGADLFALNSQEVCAYVGSRTDKAIASILKTNFPGVAVSTIQANIHGVPQHILGGVHILDNNLATRRVQYCTDTLADYKFIDFEEDKEITEGFSLNIVTLAPREVLMPANMPKTKRKLESHGITCHEVDIAEIHKMGGGLACMTLPLWRESCQPGKDNVC